MKKYLIIIVFLFGCSQAEREKANMDQSVSSGSANLEEAPPLEKQGEFISSSAAKQNNDTSKKFIRTADMKFRVKNVQKTTIKIEDLVAKHGGYVTHTNLQTSNSYTSITPISEDSVLETVNYTVINDMVLRVPDHALDTTIREIALYIDFLNHRIIKAKDVTLQLYANKLTQQRIKKHESRLQNAIDSQGKKLPETSNAEDRLVDRQQQADQSHIDNLNLMSQVQLSTISLNIYQRESIRREVLANGKNIEAYEPGFGRKVINSVKFGWLVLEGILLFVLKIWAIILIGIIGLIIYKWISKR